LIRKHLERDTMSDHVIPPELVAKLLRTGRSNDPSQAIVSEFSAYDQNAYSSFMRMLPAPWKQVGNALSESDLFALIRAIVVAEETLPNWNAGSVSPAIWLFRIFNEKYPAEARQLADWILANSSNGWLPYGSANYGADSIAEYEIHHRVHNEAKSNKAQIENVRALEGKRRRADEATAKLFGAVKRNDIKAVAALLAQGANSGMQGTDGLSAIELAKSLNRTAIYNAMISDETKHG